VKQALLTREAYPVEKFPRFFGSDYVQITRNRSMLNKLSSDLPNRSVAARSNWGWGAN
jgi:hypothetical protein